MKLAIIMAVSGIIIIIGSLAINYDVSHDEDGAYVPVVQTWEA